MYLNRSAQRGKYGVCSEETNAVSINPPFSVYKVPVILKVYARQELLRANLTTGTGGNLLVYVLIEVTSD